MITYRIWYDVLLHAKLKYYGMFDSFDILRNILLSPITIILDLILSPLEIISIIIYKIL